MNRSLRLGTYFGIPVYLHWSFSFLILYIVYNRWQDGMDIENIAWFLVYILSIFFCVTLHEYGHALTAKRFDIHTRDIILSPIGGVARLTSIPRKWQQEFLIAIAGPAVNLVIVILGIGLYYIINGDLNIIPDFNNLEQFQNNIKSHLFFLVLTSNLFLALFNLIPAFPMDGGRVFRALLSIRLSYLKATLIAARIGQIIAVGFIIWMLYELEPINLLVGAFLLFASSTELRAVKYRHWLDGLTIDFLGQKVIKINSENELHFDTRRSSDHYWMSVEKHPSSLQFLQTRNNLIQLRRHEEVSAKLSMQAVIELIKSDPASLLVYKNKETEDYNAVDHQHFNLLPELYSKRNSKTKLIKRLLKF